MKRDHVAWMRGVLLTAALYNVLWGAFVVLFPFALFGSLGMELPNHPEIWQRVGMIVGVYGVGYAVATLAPLRHWPVVLAGLLGKVFGPVGFVSAVPAGDLPLCFGLTLLTNGVISGGSRSPSSSSVHIGQTTNQKRRTHERSPRKVEPEERNG